MRKQLAWLCWFLGMGAYGVFLAPYIREGDMILIGLIGGAPFLLWAASALPCLHRRILQRVLFYTGLLGWVVLVPSQMNAFPAAGAYDYIVRTAAGLVLFVAAGFLAPNPDTAPA
jgi:hypothetical protein